MTMQEKAAIVLRCNAIADAQAIVEAMVIQCGGQPDVPTFEFITAICALRPDAFSLEIKD
jgi:hypothetical protein